jgi:hypothetical protein
MRWTGHVARLEERRNTDRDLLGKTERKRQFKRTRCRKEYDIKKDFKEAG